MEFFPKLIDVLLHFNTYLSVLIQQCGLWTYLILFGVIFAETGFVVTPFLPGDSLLFVLGAFSAQGTFNPFVLSGILMFAAILGDSVNYAIGKYLGNRLISARHIPFFKKEHLDRTHHFYKKYGGKTIILARFIPIVRMFAPFIAGIVRMDYAKFFIYNVIGGILWVAIFVFGGFYFGNIPIVKENFSVVTLLIISISIIPVIVEFIKARRKKNLP
ncbi:MAG: DedA family protein [Candidatus Omnitrophica bacterium]|nr:DedA family protein [Candidatus Omnitrophota bacterium]